MAVVLVVAATLAGLFKPWPLAKLVDRLWTPIPGRDVAWAAAMILGAYATHALLQAAVNLVLIRTGLRGLARIRRAVFDALLGRSLRQTQADAAGDLVYRATWDTYAFQTLFHHGLFTFLMAVSALAGMTVVMARENLRLTLVAWLAVPPLLALMPGLGRRMRRLAGRAQEADSRVANAVQQTVDHLALTQAYTREAVEAEGFRRLTGDARATRWTQHLTEVGYLALVGTVFAAGTAAVVAVGIREVGASRLTLGGFLVFVAYLAQFFEPLQQLSNVGSTVSQARAGVARVFELLDRPAELVSGTRRAELRPASRDGRALVAIRGVQFGYQSPRPVLRGIDLELFPGETVALVGPSGSGKTTLLQLLPRFYDPDVGTVEIGGIRLPEWDLAALRRQIAVVPQEPVLFPGTVAENIAAGRPDASAAEIERAAREAQAAEFIRRLPQGYETRLGDAAARLSVGEKQRINLARAFLKDAPILLLDEPTSALDPANEEALLAALDRLRAGRTTLMVAHRLVTLAGADRVALLLDGRLADLRRRTEIPDLNAWMKTMTNRANA